jgi:hypothetical protein
MAIARHCCLVCPKFDKTIEFLQDSMAKILNLLHRGGSSTARGRRGSADEGGLGLERGAAEELKKAPKVRVDSSTTATAASNVASCSRWFCS